jgi:hypothetical protein
MAFYDIAIHDGCMAGLERLWHLVFPFNLTQGIQLIKVSGITVIYQVIRPITAASSTILGVDHNLLIISDPFLYLRSKNSAGRKDQREQQPDQ